ncbi:Probable microtubule-binding protein TANGLED [Linum perenne]
MVARTPPKQRRLVVAPHPLPLSPRLIRETVNKVEKCMARLQELQYTVTGGNKVISGVSLSPRSTRGYLRTSLRCKQESLRLKSSASKKSPIGKLPQASSLGEWRRTSLPAMLLGETMGEILKASQFAKEIVSSVEGKAIDEQEDPRTPPIQQRRKLTKNPESYSALKSKRYREKGFGSVRSDSSGSPPRSNQRVRSRINFRVSSPPKIRSEKKKEKESSNVTANRVSPRHKPWAKKAVLFPNPVFLNSSPPPPSAAAAGTSRRPATTPHKFLIKSPVKTRVHRFPVTVSSPPAKFGKKKETSSPAKFAAATASKLRRSFSPSRIANRLASLSPLKGRRMKNGDCCGDGSTAGDKISGLKRRPVMVAASSFSPRRFSIGGRI